MLPQRNKKSRLLRGSTSNGTPGKTALLATDPVQIFSKSHKQRRTPPHDPFYEIRQVVFVGARVPFGRASFRIYSFA
jgi:hypothetical protein